ncbi:MAG: hypothetical protein GY922_02350, partial [Proteobacteria bacterium]|nr:hypothetical protein [Pseudomonadota bacterium]
MSKEGVKAAADITDAINTIKSAWKGMFFRVLDHNAKFLTKMAKMTEVFARSTASILTGVARNFIIFNLKMAKPMMKLMGMNPGAVDMAVGAAGKVNSGLNAADLAAFLKDMVGTLNGTGGGDGDGDGEGIKPNKIPGTTVPTWGDVMKYRIDAFSKGIPSGVTGGVTSAMSSVGSFVGGAGVGQGVSRVVEVGEKQLDEQKKTNEKLDEMKRM